MLKVSVSATVAAVILVIAFLDVGASTEKMPRKWIPVSVNFTGLSAYNVSDDDVKEEILCSILATNDGLANLFCFGPKGCVFGHVNASDVEGERTPGYTCSYSQVCLHGNETHFEGEMVLDTICPNLNLTCTKRGLVNIANDVPPLTSCTPPFVQHPFGCMYFNMTAALMLCEAKAYCQSLGAQVASPTTHDNYLALTAYLTATYGSVVPRTFWAGVYYINGNWSYESNGRWPGPAGQYEWDPNLHGYVGQNCATFYSVPLPYTFQLVESSCTANRSVICHAWNLEI